MIRKFWVVLWVLMIFTPPGVSHSKGDKLEEIRTVVVYPFDMTDQRLKSLRRQNFNHLSFYVGWSEVEAKKGHFDFTEVDKSLKFIRSHGFKVILLLDAGGSRLIDANGVIDAPEEPMSSVDGKSDVGKNAVPDWIRSNPNQFAFDFSGNITRQLGFNSERVLNSAEKFFQTATKHFMTRFPGLVTGFGIGIQEEHEIKFGQTGYQWRDYSPEALAAFRKVMPNVARLPVINYNNQIGAAPKSEPLLISWVKFREDRIIDVTCRLSRAIKSNAGKTVGYFGEFFTSHDAIYAIGVVDRLAPCIDIAVADFNFSDGYGTVLDPWVIRLMVNHMRNVGYKRILAGVYAERILSPGADKKSDMEPLAASVALASSERKYDGFELGGLHKPKNERQIAPFSMELSQDFMALTKEYRAANTRCHANGSRIGIYASKDNFYFWHGERTSGKNIHRESLIRLFQLLCESGRYSPEIIGDSNLKGLDGRFAAVFVPHQAALSDESIGHLGNYVRHGGKLIQDMRLGEFSLAGSNRGGWMSKTFGIRGIEWNQNVGQFWVKKGVALSLDANRHAGFSHAILTPMPEFKLLAPSVRNPSSGIGILGKNTLVFGAMPHLVERGERQHWHAFMLDSIDILLEKPQQELAK